MWRERLSRRAVTCNEVAQRMVDDDFHDRAGLDRSRRRHVEQCLRCQAEVAQQRKLTRALQALQSVVVEPPPGFLSEVAALVDDEPLPVASRGLLSGRRVAYAGGLAVATAAGAVSAAVLTARSRRTHASV